MGLSGKREAAAYAAVTLALLYHVAMLTSVVGHQPGQVTLIDRLHPVSIRKDTFGEDTNSYYQAGHSFLKGHTMYGLEGAEFVAPKVVEFGYHPVMGIAFAGVNLVLSFQEAHFAIILAQELLLIGTALALIRRLKLSRHRALLLVAMLFGYTPLHPEFYIGQVNVMVGVFLVAIVLVEERHRPIASSIAWGASLVLKSSLIVLAPLYLRQRRILRLVLVLGFAFVSGAAYFFFHPDSCAKVIHFFFHEMARSTANSLGLHSFLIDLGLRAGLSTFPAIHFARNLTALFALSAVAILFPDPKPAPTRRSCFVHVAVWLRFPQGGSKPAHWPTAAG